MTETVERLQLNPDDLADLRRSGLSDETIRSMGCFSADTKTIRMRTGVKKVSCGGYAITYAGISDQTGQPYVRWRLRKPTDGMRYVSGRGDDAQPYIPPGFENLLPSDLLVVTEGEKKAAKAVQEGIHCIALQGVWSWPDAEGRAVDKLRGDPVCEETVPHAALLEIARRYKHVLVLGDSDLILNQQGKAGIELLTKSLASKGIRAAAAYCPPTMKVDAHDHRIEKQGLDDWIIADHFQAKRCLPALFRASEVNHFGITDDYNAQVFVEEFPNRLAYSQGLWRRWNGLTWQIDDCGGRRELMTSIATIYRSETDTLGALRSKVLAPFRGAKRDQLPGHILAWIDPVEAAIKSLREAARNIGSRHGVDAALDMAQSRLRVPDEVWDRNPHLLAVKNGVVDLRNAELLPALPEQMITKCAGASYEPNAHAPKFMEFLAQVQPDPEIREYLHRLAGYCATGKSHEQKFFTFVGCGANGKGTFMGMLMDALGEYAIKGSTSLLAQQSPDKIRNDLAKLAGARLASFSETPANLRLDEAMIKSMTGGDLITARFLNREFFQFRPSFTPILDTNYAPRPRDNGHAIWRRLVVVPWSIVIQEDEQDSNLREALLQELPGILTWVIQGAKKYLEDGLPVCRQITTSSQELRTSCDDVQRWVDGCTVQGPRYRAQSSTFYEEFRRWATAEGITNVLNATEFRRSLEEKGFECKKKNGGLMTWLGIKLSDDANHACCREALAEGQAPTRQSSKDPERESVVEGRQPQPTAPPMQILRGGSRAL